jgi:hypothetical protein
MPPGSKPEGPRPTPASGSFSSILGKGRCYNFEDKGAQDRSIQAFLMAGARMQLRFLLVAMMACLLAGPCRADQAKAKIHRTPAPIAATPQPVTAPAAPLRPEQMPATPPQVSFRSGQLTITAQNSTLGDILRAVRNQTGAAVEVPANATERVVGNFGPGPARDVLSSLLNGSHFNYVLLGSATNPDALERVILIVKSSTEPAATSETASAMPPAPADNPDMVAEEADQAPEENNLFAEDPNTPAEDQTQNPFGQTPANTRTPEQMLQDMQHQQEVQQQIQQRQQQLGIPPGMQGPRGLPMPVPGNPAPQPQ